MNNTNRICRAWCLVILGSLFGCNAPTTGGTENSILGTLKPDGVKVPHVVPGQIGTLWREHGMLKVFHPGYFKSGTTGSCFYLADNLSGDISVYDAGSLHQIGDLTSPKSYGWGVAASASSIYAGTYYDTIDEYAPCSGSRPTKTLTGGGNGYPLGIAISPSGAVYADEWPTNRVDIWSSGKRSSGSDNLESSIYYLAVDREGHVFTSGYGKTAKYGFVDRCDSEVKQCTTLVTGIGFPGGIAFDSSQHLYVVDAANNVTEYSGCTDRVPKCKVVSSLGLGVLTFSAIALSTPDNYLWAGNYFQPAQCSSGYFDCGNAIALRLPLQPGQPARQTTIRPDTLPLGIAYWKPSPI